MFRTILFLFLMANSIFAYEYGVIKTWYANVREKPSLNSKIVVYHKIGTIVKFNYFNDKWVKLSNKYFISRKVIKPIENSNITIKTVNKATVRDIPYFKGKVVSQIDKNTNLKAIVLLDNGWYLLNNGNFIYSSNVVENIQLVHKSSLDLNIQSNPNDLIIKTLLKLIKQSQKNKKDIQTILEKLNAK